MNGVKPVTLSYDKTVPKGGADEQLPPVVLLSGLAQTKERWKTSTQILADASKRIVYAVDARNHGNSEQTDFFDFNVLAIDMNHFLNTHNINRASIVGHSVGGIAAMSMALTMADKVEKIVIEDMSPKKLMPELCAVLAEMVREQSECLKLLPPNVEEEFVHRQMKECIYRTVPMIPDEDHEILERMQFPIMKTETGFEYQANLTAIFKALQEPDTLFRGYSGVFEGDALFIYGGCSSMRVHDDQELILKHFPKASFKCVPKAGHEVYKYNPQEFVTHLVEFLQTI